MPLDSVSPRWWTTGRVATHVRETRSRTTRASQRAPGRAVTSCARAWQGRYSTRSGHGCGSAMRSDFQGGSGPSQWRGVSHPIGCTDSDAEHSPTQASSRLPSATPRRGRDNAADPARRLVLGVACGGRPSRESAAPSCRVRRRVGGRALGSPSPQPGSWQVSSGRVPAGPRDGPSPGMRRLVGRGPQRSCYAVALLPAAMFSAMSPIHGSL